ncbi:kinase-like protein [Dendrothele bispora CBS 962.96]|uniref:Kinase-like protein n=1 Tax=Dendrothele bispora (strain CBS 962.96) TaxID=1314807 RepID=A0A4V4HF34_DENBC|nr:kinase-like protein [Dendrothele bispora CBS 962.96]
MKSVSDTFGGAKEDVSPCYVPDDDYDVIDENEEDYVQPPHLVDDVRVSRSPTLGGGSGSNGTATRPTIVISNTSTQPGSFSSITSAVTPITPNQRYRGWLSEVLKPLEQFIDEPIDPREYYLGLQEIAEGESGSVYAARIAENADLSKLKLPPMLKDRDVENQQHGQPMLVAIKSVAILPSGSAKLDDLKKELTLLKGLAHPDILSLDALYVDLVEDSLWVRMELMERSLADVVALVGQGLVLQERTIARFTSDILEALQYLRDNNIAHRDVRSDNLLLNSDGVLKLTDFSNAIQVSPASPTCTDAVGVLYWQAPEIRTGSYNALKVDIWSVGATVWEMAEAEPPFADTSVPADRWPPLGQPQLYSPAFREFLRLCSEPAASRPDPLELMKNGFVNNTCGRAVIVQLLQQCMAIEKAMQDQAEDSDS